MTIQVVDSGGAGLSTNQACVHLESASYMSPVNICGPLSPIGGDSYTWMSH